MRTVRDIKNWRGKRALLRADFNVPVEKGKVKDDFKIRKSLPTIKYLLAQGAKVVLVSHLGRPGGVDRKFTLEPVRKSLEALLQEKVGLIKMKKPENYFREAAAEIDKLKNGRALLLENIRFSKSEEENKNDFSRKLSELADIFVLDGFAVAHRDASSVSGVARYLPAYAGLLLEEETRGLSRVVEGAVKPFVLVLGGAKMETKIPVLKNLMSQADHILIGGGIANTYFWARGYGVGASLVDKKFKEEILRLGAREKVVMPIDAVIGLENGKNAQVVKMAQGVKIKNSEGIFDIGPATIRLYARFIKSANTLVWNGAMGYFEKHPYQYGTDAIARLVASRSKGKAFGVAGGGETVEVIRKLDLARDIDLVSTGGGAMLEFLAGKQLPGLKALK
ncbi:phosphoglycerate kinase [Patescibacteria group bacterium]|nr:MAG: phosphoglycerate kinase [Patescibacteria group bacterium]